jgi:mannosyltransferase
LKDQLPSGSIAPVSISLASIVVFALAVALRVPSCYESFWVDELHSAWCVWDALGDVASRADIGHQSPFYFVGLWFWKQLLGESELVLRLSSVLAVAAGCVVLTAGIARWSRSLTAGLTAGLILAIESNSIFFGTELRPFAFVILFGSIATVCFARLAMLNSRHDQRGAWIGMVVAILLAGLCQPTSLGVLILLPGILCCLWFVRERKQLIRFTLTDGWLLLTATAVGFALWSTTLGESWDQRQTWASFASATSIDQAWQTWDWVSLWCAPIFVLIAAMIIGRNESSSQSLPTLLLAMITVVGTLGYWFVAWMEWLPLWHRRYFIAVLPMFAFIAGGSIACVAANRRFRKLAPLIAVCLVFSLAYRQNLLRSLQHYPVALAARGEDWRGAIDWVRNEANPEDRIYVESGLIESQQWLAGAGEMNGRIHTPPTPPQLQYLCYPALGPYRLEQTVKPIALDLELSLEVINDDTKQIFLIVRRPIEQIKIGPTKWGWVHGNRYVGEVKSFGNVTVIPMPDLADDR